MAEGTPIAATASDLTLARVLGLVILLPVIQAVAHPSAAHVGAAALGLTALAIHQVVLLDRVWPTRAVLAAAVVMLLLGYAAHRLTGDDWILVATAAAICVAVRVSPLQLALASVAACTAAAFAMAPAHRSASTIVLLVAGPGCVAALRQRLVSTIAQLQAAREELAHVAVEAERSRFSEELHDVLGHSLSVMVVAAQVVQKSVVRAPEQAIESAQEIEQVGRRALEEVRDTVSEYRGRTVATELAEVQRALAASAIAVTADFDSPVPSSVDGTLAVILRELVTNVIRHSGASHCRLSLVLSADHATLSVSDDGPGEDSALQRAEAGLRTVRRRAARRGGDVQVATDGHHGLKVTVRLPVPGAESSQVGR